MLKEEAKIRLRREANQVRCQRFQDSRQRLIGVDVDALDAQVEESRRHKAQEIHSGKMESECIETLYSARQ